MTKKLRVMIVEGNDAVCTAMVVIARNRKFQADGYANSKHAVEMLEALKYAIVVVSDNTHAPADTARLARQSGAKIVWVVSSPYWYDIAMNSGADAIVEKPFDVDDFADVLGNLAYAYVRDNDIDLDEEDA